MADILFEKAAIIGAGLMGASLARGLAEAGAAGEIALYDAAPDVRARAGALGLGTIGASLAATVADADLVVLAVPVGAFGAVAAAMAGDLAPGAVVSDLGSVKSEAIAAITPHLPGHCFFVPGHPIAGTEQSGPEAGFAALFHNRWQILTPLPDPRPAYGEQVERLRALWTRLGSRVEIMTPARHDLVLAVTSHLPHLIAFNIVATAADLESVTDSEVVKYSAAGFRDFTRIAASDPVMWRDVFLANKDCVLEMLARFNEDLAALARAIRWGDGAFLETAFTRARGVRRRIVEAGQDSADPNFGRDRPVV